MSILVMSLWALNITFDTLGQIAFKYAAIAPDNRSDKHYWIDLMKSRWLWVGIGSYVAEFFLWLAFLSLVPLSQAILLGCFNIITVMIAGRILFKEKLVPYRIAGIVLITIGVFFVGIS